MAKRIAPNVMNLAMLQIILYGVMFILAHLQQNGYLKRLPSPADKSLSQHIGEMSNKANRPPA